MSKLKRGIAQMEDESDTTNVETQGIASTNTEDNTPLSQRGDGGDFLPEPISDNINGMTFTGDLQPSTAALTDKDDRIKLAVFQDQQVAAGKFITAVAIHTIYKHGLHYELGYESFKELVESRYQITYRTASNYCAIIDALGNGERVKELMNRNSLTKLLDVSKELKEKNKTEDNGKIFLEIDGEQVEQTEYVNKLLAEEKVKMWETKDKAESQLKSVESKKNSLEKDLAKETERANKLQTKLDAMAATKGLSPELIIKAKNTKEAEKQITEALVKIANQFEVLENIPYEFRTPRLATDIQRSISVIHGSINALEKTWADHLDIIKKAEPVTE